MREFYRSNASFFLLVIGLAAGFMRSYEHMALAEFFVSSSLVLLIPITIWILYALKVSAFNLNVLNRNENGFLYNFPFLSGNEQWITISQAVSVQLMPVVLYAIFLMAVAWKNNVPDTSLLVAASCLSIIAVSSLRLFYLLRNPHAQNNIWKPTQYLNTKFTKPYFLFFPEWVLRRQALMVIGTKVFSGLVLFAVSELYKTDEYDLRLFAMGVVLSFSSNVNIVWELHRFDNVHLNIVRNLPLPFAKRAGYFLLTAGLLILPEAGIIVKNFSAGFNTTELLSAVLFGSSILILFYGCLYLKDIGQDQLMTLVFFIAIALIIFILFQIPLLILTLSNFCIGLLIWRTCFYTFEQVAKENS